MIDVVCCHSHSHCSQTGKKYRTLGRSKHTMSTSLALHQLQSAQAVLRRSMLHRQLLFCTARALTTTFRRIPGTQRKLSSARPLPDDEFDAEEWMQESQPMQRKNQEAHHNVPNSSEPMMGAFTSENSDEASSPLSFPSFSPATLSYSPDSPIPITSVPHLVRPGEDLPRGIWPAFRLMDQDGHFRDPSLDGYDSPNHHFGAEVSEKDDFQDLDKFRAFLAKAYPFQANEILASGLLHPNKKPFIDTQSTNTLLRAHRQMIRLRQMDDILLNVQRQGRISFYMACRGEEAIHMGAASALNLDDPVFAQYREQGVLMWRGFSLEQFTNQCFSNVMDLCKGRQMPVHYGSRALNYHTISSPLGTQLPQAVGAAYRLKLAGQPNVAVCFFGDGAASTTDFHSAMNFAATLKAPVVFLCRNNGYAISTPASDQYAGDGVVSRGPGYGMAAVRVDGNDMFAVHAAVREAKRYALDNSAPVLIEAMTYRQSHHSTSDDSSRYRGKNEVEECAHSADPVDRVEAFLKRFHLMSDEKAAAIHEEERASVLQAMEKAENAVKPPLDELFTDVYSEMPESLRQQQADLEKHIAKYPDKY